MKSDDNFFRGGDGTLTIKADKATFTIAEQWEPTPYLGYFKRPDGDAVLRQQWFDRTTGKTEWRPIPEIFNP